MSTFWDPKKTPGIKEPKDPNTSSFSAPEGLWISCDECHAVLQNVAVEKNLHVCPECQYHFRIGSQRRIELIADEGSIEEHDAEVSPKNFLGFFDSKSYDDRILASQKKTSLQDAFVSVSAKIEGIPVQMGAFEFSFMGGSMGTVVGEKVARVFERAYENRQPAILFHSSGGARMQEGLLSLMQMAKATVVLSKLKQAGIPYISVMTDPTTGGVAASFAMQGDYHMAEPKALIGFAGPRVIEQTINEKLPEGFQTSEFLLAHGMIDSVVSRKDMKAFLAKVLRIFQSS